MTFKLIQKAGKNLADFVYKRLGNGSGNMILITSMTGIALSSLAQTGAIFFNKKYSVSQKAFMIPQELTEGCITLLSMFLVTRPIQKLSAKYVKSGKILSKELSSYMIKNNLLNKRGKSDFNLEEYIKSTMNNISSKSTTAERKTKMLKPHQEALHNYESVFDATSAICTTAGSIVSTALISPLLRNYVASKYQKTNLNIYNNIPDECKQKIRRIEPRLIFYSNPLRIY